MTPGKKLALRLLLVYVVASLVLIGVKFVRAVGEPAPTPPAAHSSAR